MQERGRGRERELEGRLVKKGKGERIEDKESLQRDKGRKERPKEENNV